MSSSLTDARESLDQGIKVLDTGLIYRNPKPHLRSIHAYFPSVANLGGDQLLAIDARGEAFEAVRLRVHVSRSTDGGRTWQQEGLLPTGIGDEAVTEIGRVSMMPGDELVVLLCRWDRRGREEEGLVNPRTVGLVPNHFLTMRSRDGGRTWSEPVTLDPPLVGPGFELCTPITHLPDGRWVLPTATWRGWDGELPNGNRMVAFVSEDRGRTWPRYLDVMRHPRDEVNYWESKIVALPDGRLVAVAWSYDEKQDRHLPVHYAVSADGGASWSPPTPTPLAGQTLTPLVLADGRLLCAYRRTDKPGLWAQVASLDGERWVNHGERALWGAPKVERQAQGIIQDFGALRFGAPCLTPLADGVFVAFWGYEDCVSVIRWFKLRVA